MSLKCQLVSIEKRGFPEEILYKLLILSVSPPGLEPGSQVPETGVLPLEFLDIRGCTEG